MVLNMSWFIFCFVVIVLVLVILCVVLIRGNNGIE